MDNDQREDIALIRRLIYGNWQSSVTTAFAELGLADILYDRPASLHTLSEKTKIEARLLMRFLRCCASLGFVDFSKHKNEIALTPFGEYLRTDHPHSQRDAARLNGAPYRYDPWGKLVNILLSGNNKSSCSLTLENGSLDYLKDKPEMREVFHKAMVNQWAIEDEQIVDSYDCSSFSHIIDIGGGHGAFIKQVLNKNSHIRGTLFDLNGTFDGLDKSQYFLDGRLSFCEGNFFESIPPDGDLYVMKNILHNWPDPKVCEILTNTHKALTFNGRSADKRLLVIEHLIQDDNFDSMVNWMDLNFFITVGGSDHTLSEYSSLFSRCGFAINRVIPVPGGRHIMELLAL